MRCSMSPERGMTTFTARDKYVLIKFLKSLNKVSITRVSFPPSISLFSFSCRYFLPLSSPFPSFLPSFPPFQSFPGFFPPLSFLFSVKNLPDGSCPRTETDLEDIASEKKNIQDEDIRDMDVLDAVSDNDNSKEDLDWTNLLCLDTAADRSV